MNRRCIAGLIRHVVRRGRQDRGSALVETAFTLPLALLVAVAIFEFGHAFQTWEILSNAAREGARTAVVPGSTDNAVVTRVQDYLAAGMVASPGSADVAIDRNVSIAGTVGKATRVTVTYPFEFMVLQPVVQLLFPAATLGESLTMQALAAMRNET